jgi:hypothetical protein
VVKRKANSYLLVWDLQENRGRRVWSFDLGYQVKLNVFKFKFKLDPAVEGIVVYK